VENYKNLSKELKKLATQVYMQELKKRSGGNNLSLVEKRFTRASRHGDDADWREYSGSFYKNARGDSALTRVELVDKIEGEWHGTRQIIDHPLWSILDSPIEDEKAINQKYNSLCKDVKTELFKDPEAEESTIRKKWSARRRLYRIGLLNNLDALACLLLLINEMKIEQRWCTYVVLKHHALSLFLRLASFEPLDHVADQIYQLIDQRFIQKNPIPDGFKSVLIKRKLLPPPQFETTDGYRKMLIRILDNAKLYGLEERDRESNLKFLFWATFFGLNDVNVALSASNSSKKDQLLLEELVSAYRSPRPYKYLPKGIFYY